MPDTETKSDASGDCPTSPKAGDPQEYMKKRERNNVAVRKSRRKAKQRIEETKQRVDGLAKENEDLRIKVALLQKELNVLRSLFANGGVTSSIPNHGVNVIFTTNAKNSSNSTDKTTNPQVVVKTEMEEDD